MNTSYKKTLTCLDTESISSVVGLMSQKNDIDLKGIVAILSSSNKLVGSFADGDLRRIVGGKTDLNLPIHGFMIKDPVTIVDSELHSASGWRRIAELEKRLSRKVKYVYVVNSKNEFLGSVDRDFYSINDSNYDASESCIMGLGFVGLTVACHISSFGSKVFGYDYSKSLIDDLQNKKTKFDEPGLLNVINESVDKDLLVFTNELPRSKVYMIAVGSPISDDGVPDLSQIMSCLQKISGVISTGTLIIIRSTIPLGSCREVFIPYLEELSGLKCGSGWYLSFAPERTLEGSALTELRNLPQIVSGYSPECMQRSSNFFQKFTKNIVEVDSLESAELAKLACNTYRDLKFSFANELSNICESYNINSRKLISKINFDYDRAGIPLPSPGVGGYCLTKDPIIYTHPSKPPLAPIELGKMSRKINNYALFSPNRALSGFCTKNKLSPNNINILIIGLAFKGSPETNDMRFSTSLDFFNSISSSVSTVYGYDNCIDQDEIEGLGFGGNFDISKLEEYDISGIFFLNNHVKNSNINLTHWLNNSHQKFIFDGWGCREDLEERDIDNFTYMTLGMLDG